jgi:hypothetical protein
MAGDKSYLPQCNALGWASESSNFSCNACGRYAAIGCDGKSRSARFKDSVLVSPGTERPARLRLRYLVRIRIPSVLGFPAMFLAVPPLMILVPAFLAFSIQIATSIVGLRTVIAVVMDCSVKVGLCLFNRMLAMRTVIGVGLGRGGHKPHKSCRDKGCYCGFCKSVQD